ncbi:MAG: hypothetical protein IJO72_02710 [Oscillospiraceae bacterium]|nr:hypothetical protein [Oscillospiraceae bacterium]MBQ9929675.1 hypothetical protein [Oscillospiraceae bacterium]
MNTHLFFTAGNTPALQTARSLLNNKGLRFTDHPTPEITHLLLPVPSFQPDGSIKGGGSIAQLLRMLPENVTIIGGNLENTAFSGQKTVDLLRDEEYLAKNAAITAHCALKIAMEQLPVTLADCDVLVIGWGRIGKCLAALLKGLGAAVTVSARKESDRAMLHALGYRAEAPNLLHRSLHRQKLIFNTVPAPVLSAERLSRCPDGCVKIDLASCPGLEGADVIHARGLPGKDAPESSGKLIADTVVRLLEGGKP